MGNADQISEEKTWILKTKKSIPYKSPMEEANLFLTLS